MYLKTSFLPEYAVCHNITRTLTILDTKCICESLISAISMAQFHSLNCDKIFSVKKKEKEPSRC